MQYDKFNTIFNRYAHIQVSSSADEPFNPYQDTVVIPAKDIQEEELSESSLLNNVILSNDISMVKDADKGGSLDSITEKDGYLILRGWGLSPENKIFIFTPESNILSIIAAHKIARKDVVAAMNDKKLINSGFDILIKPLVNEPRFCLLSYSDQYGYKVLPIINKDNKYDCSF